MNDGPSSFFRLLFDFTPTYQDVGHPILIRCSAVQRFPNATKEITEFTILKIANVMTPPQLISGNVEYVKCDDSDHQIALTFTGNPLPRENQIVVTRGGIESKIALGIKPKNGSFDVLVPAKVFKAGNELHIRNEAGSYKYPLMCMDFQPDHGTSSPSVGPEVGLGIVGWTVIVVISLLSLAILSVIVGVCISRR